MYSFHIKLAGIIINITTIYPDTMELCENYLTDEAGELSVETDESIIDGEREKSIRQELVEGLPHCEYGRGYLETLAVYRIICAKLLDYNCILMHGAVVAVDNKAYLFTAKSGTGKTTHISLWQKKFGERCVVINGDKPLLIIRGDRVCACGTPWSGKENLNTNGEAPLKAICLLTRGETNIIEKISPSELMTVLLRQIFVPQVPNANIKVMQIIAKIAKEVGFYRLACNMEPEAADVSYEGMNQ